MIVLVMHEPGYGVAKSNIGGIYNFQDPVSQIGVQIPADQDSIVEIMLQSIPCLDEDRRRRVREALMPGLVMPDQGALDPARLGMSEDGPPR